MRDIALGAVIARSILLPIGAMFALVFLVSPWVALAVGGIPFALLGLLWIVGRVGRALLSREGTGSSVG